MAFFSALAGAASAAFTFATTTAIGQFATGVAINALAGALAQPQDGRGQNPGIERTVRQGIVPRSLIMGRYATGGSLVYHTTTGIGRDDPTELYVAVYALSDLPVRGLSGLWIDGKQCTIDGRAGYDADYGKGMLIPEFADDIDANGQIKAFLKFYDGSQTEADQYLIDHCSTDERPWTANHVGHGIAYAILTFDYDPNLFQGFPTVLFEVDGIPLDNPTGTAGYRNPAVQVYNLLQPITFNGEWLYGPQVPAVLDRDHWAGAISDCDQQHPDHATWSDQAKREAFGSLTIPPRYQSGMEVQVDRPISEYIEMAASACNGRVAEIAGAYKFQVGDPPTQADFTFTDGDVLNTSEHSFSPFLPLAETVNAVTAIYPDPEQQYEDQEPDPLYVPEYEAEDGNRRLTTTVRLDAVTSGEQVQRLMKSSLAEARRARRHTIRMTPDFWRAEPGQYAAWNSERNGYVAKLFRVDGVSDEPDGDVILDLTEVDPEDYDFGEVDFTPVRSNPLEDLGPGTFTVPGFGAFPYTIRRDDGRPSRPAVQMVWDSDRPGRGLIYRIFAAGTDNVVTRGRVAYDEGEHVTADGIAAGAALEVQVRREMRRGRAPWSPRYAVTAPGVRFGEADLAAYINDRIRQLQDLGQQREGDLVDLFDRIDEQVAEARNDAQTAIERAELLAEQRDNLIPDPQFESDPLSVWQATNGMTGLDVVSIAGLPGRAERALSAQIGSGDGSPCIRYVGPGLNNLGDSAIRYGFFVRSMSGQGTVRPQARIIDASGSYLTFASGEGQPVTTDWTYIRSDIDIREVDGAAAVSQMIARFDGLPDGTEVRIAAPDLADVTEAADIRSFVREYSYARSDVDESIAAAKETLQSDYNGKFSTYNDQIVTLSNRQGTQAGRISELQSTTADTINTVTNLSQTVSDNEDAFSQDITRVETKVGDVESRAELALQSTVDEDGNPISLARLAAGTGRNQGRLEVFSGGQFRGMRLDGTGIFGGPVQSESFNDDNGWILYQNGDARFNGVVVSRQIQVATGTISFSAGFGQSETGEQTRVIDTGFSIRPWEGSKRTFIAVCGLEGDAAATRYSDSPGPGPENWWDWSAEVAGRTRWFGANNLMIRATVRVQHIRTLDGRLRWRLYEVT